MLTMIRGTAVRCAMFALLLLTPALLAACTVATPGLPRVWPAQSLSPNAQAEAGGLLRLTIRATNDSPNRENGGANKVQTFTTLPPGVELLDFTSSDVGRLPETDPNRAWLQEVDPQNRVVVIWFGAIGASESKTATLTLRVAAPAGAALPFRTLLIWSNAAPDAYECNLSCLDELQASTADDPQVQAYIAVHRDDLAALLRTYQGGGNGLANPVEVTVGERAQSATAPQVALLVGQRHASGVHMMAKAAFTPGEPVMLWYNLPGGVAGRISRTDALEDGSLDWSMDLGDWQGIPPGATSVVAHGQYSGVEALYLFNR